MNWIIVMWMMGTSACLTIALIHLVIWFDDKKSYTYLLFASAALAVAGIAMCESQMILAQTPELFGATIAIRQGVESQWTRVGELSSLLLLAFVVDASIQLWATSGPDRDECFYVTVSSVPAGVS